MARLKTEEELENLVAELLSDLLAGESAWTFSEVDEALEELNGTVIEPKINKGHLESLARDMIWSTRPKKFMVIGSERRIRSMREVSALQKAADERLLTIATNNGRMKPEDLVQTLANMIHGNKKMAWLAYLRLKQAGRIKVVTETKSWVERA